MPLLPANSVRFWSLRLILTLTHFRHSYKSAVRTAAADQTKHVSSEQRGLSEEGYGGLLV